MTNELMVQNGQALVMDGTDFIMDLTSERQTSFTSMKATTKEEKALMFKAMNNPEHRLGDKINEVINVKDVYVEVVNCVSKETGETTQCPRIVLVDADGVGYQCVSVGIFSALKKMMTVFGVPTWDEPIAIKIKQISRGDRKILTFDIVG